jgi:hypothetical protein
MTSTTTKPDSLQPAADMAGDLFDDWFDPLEAEVRARSREFIEELLRGELEAALSRPRYGRSPISGSEGRASVAGHRHGSRTRPAKRQAWPQRVMHAAGILKPQKFASCSPARVLCWIRRICPRRSPLSEKGLGVPR